MRIAFTILALLALCGLAHGEPATKPATKASNETLLKGVTTPAGFDMTVFAQPPDVNYPTCLTATPRGEVFVGIDEQGSLGKDKDRGRVVRCIDRDGDGVADEIKTFVKLEHPRGLIWDDATGALYVQHPGDLTRHFDDDHDGVADRVETLVTGLWNPGPSNARGADHTTNGIRLGIDGWIYIAVGDFGAVDAIGADGTHLKHRGGGIARVRTDGSGLEMYATGTRNIYDIAIDPLMNIFTRDNTNDGDGWNDRLTYSPPGAFHGYPTRFKRFPEDFVDCMIDFGGGSPCGSLFLDEPGFPQSLGHALYTVEWGQSVVDRHPLTANGAGFKATTEQLMKLPRGTDIDVDGASRLYVSSWAGGGFSYTDPNVGYVLRLTPKGYTAPAFPDLAKASDEELLAHLKSVSGVCRQGAQSEILKRGEKPVFADGLARLTASDAPMATRVLALFTLKGLRSEAANLALLDFAQRDDLREFALRALADRKGDASVPAAPFVAALRDPNPRVRTIAAWALARLGHAEAATAILPLTADADPIVAHVAINALVTLRAIDSCLAAVSTADPKLAEGALRVLRQIHEDAVVSGLIARLDVAKDTSLRSQIYGALCRLYFREADWNGEWWGTRPESSGPYYQPVKWSATPRIGDLIRSALTKEDTAVIRSLLIDAAANKLDLPEVNDQLSKTVMTDGSLAGPFVETLAGRKDLSDGELAAVKAVIASDAIPPAVRGKAIRILGEEVNDPAAIATAVEALGRVAVAEKPDPELSAALDSFTQNPQQFRQMKVLAELSAKGSAGSREVVLATLINLCESKLTKPDPRARAEKIIDKTWNDPATVAPLLRAIGRTKAQRYGEQVRSRMKDADTSVASAASYAAGRLGISADGAATKPRDTIASLGYDKAIPLVAKLDGDPARGKELFTTQGCVACHTVSPEDPPKGPFLGGIATRYSRAELLESILKPSAKIAQGFDTQWFKTKNDVLEGFVSRESGDEIELRNATGAVTVLKKDQVKQRGKRDTSMMPIELADKLSPQELASLIAYLESVKAK